MNKRNLPKPRDKSIILLLSILLNIVAAECLWAQIRIMPLGDSITRGLVGSSENIGYRRLLYLDLKGSGYDVNFVGGLTDGIPLDFDRNHEGHGGFLASEIAAEIGGYLDANPPDIILLHIGTNDIDILSTEDPSDVAEILNAIDDWETANSKSIIIILARIINQSGYLCPDDSMTTRFNDNVEAMALGRINDRIVIVDMECSAGLDYFYDMVDAIHPNQAGYDKMAAKWYADLLERVLPHADAGEDQNVSEGALVNLDGRGSIDPDGAFLSYSWKQIPTDTVVLMDPGTVNPTFTAPPVGLSGARLTFELTVTDADGFQHSDTVLVDINDVLVPPVADAGSDQIVAPATKVTLNGTNSYDPDGLISSVQWEQIAGATQVSLTAPNELITDFTAPMTGGELLEFKLTLLDDTNQVSEDTVKVTTTTTPVDTPVSGGGGGGGGCFIMTAGE
jgi:lysophospholipase L1-like esterase